MKLSTLGKTCPKCGSDNKWLSVKISTAVKSDIIIARHDLVCCGQLIKGNRVFLCEFTRTVTNPPVPEMNPMEQPDL